MNEEWSKPKTTTVETRNFFREVFEVAGMLRPYTASRDPKTWGHGVTQKDMAAAWDKLLEDDKIAAKLSGILLDTGDVKNRSFDRMWFGGNGAYSTLREQILLDRIRYGTSLISGWNQGAQIENVEQILQDIVQDVAVALTGKEVIFPEEE